MNAKNSSMADAVYSDANVLILVLDIKVGCESCYDVGVDKYLHNALLYMHMQLGKTKELSLTHADAGVTYVSVHGPLHVPHEALWLCNSRTTQRTWAVSLSIAKINGAELCSRHFSLAACSPIAPVTWCAQASCDSLAGISSNEER